VLNETGLIRFKKVVYFFKRIKKEFIKEIHKEPLVRYLRINKTREAVAVCYYFLFILRIVKRVVKKCNIYNKLKVTTHKLYKLLMLLFTLKELQISIAIDFIVKLLLLKELITRTTYNSI
jgi:hypothetical protein